MKNQKKWIIIGSVVVAIVALVLVFTLGGNKDANIILQSATYTQDLYEGEELDLTKGLLTYEVNGTIKNTDFSSEGVSVGGYNKNLTGEQTLTVTYKEQSIEFTVQVLSRLTVLNAKDKYLIGEEFKYEQGNVKVRLKDGSTKEVSLSSANVTVEGFDSTSAQEVNLTVKYSEGEENYQTTINVQILDYEVSITVPRKKVYQSYEDLSVDGGLVAIKVNGKDYDYVVITPDMISGFDITAVSESVPTTKQTLTVKYVDNGKYKNGLQKNYEIDLTYSKISWLKEVVKEIDKVEWPTEGLPTFDNDLAEDAMLAMDYYFTITDQNELKAITDAELNSLIRAATACAYTAWSAEMDVISRTIYFYIDEANLNPDYPFRTVLGCKNRDEAVEDFNKLKDPTSDVNRYANLLVKLDEKFRDTLVSKEYDETQKEYFDSTVGMYAQYPYMYEYYEVYKKNLPFIEYMTGITDLVDDIPDGWTNEQLQTTYKEEVEAVIKYMKDGGYVQSGYYSTSKVVHGVVDRWCGNNFYDIVYSYYFYNDELKSKIKDELYFKLPLPGELAEWDNLVISANSLIVQYGQYIQAAKLFDNTMIMLAARRAEALAKEIKEGDNELYKGLYDLLDGDYQLLAYVVYNKLGTKTQAGELFDDPEFDALWDAYDAMFELVDEKGKIDIESNAAFFDNVFKTFVNMSPAWQYSFIASLNNSYRDYATAIIVDKDYILDHTDKVFDSQFIFILHEYIMSKLSYTDGQEKKLYERANTVAQYLLLAIEQYALRYVANGASLDAFDETMRKAVRDYRRLEGDERTAFDNILGDVYDKYYSLWENSLDISIPDGWTNTFEEMKNLLVRTFEVMELLENQPNSANKDKWNTIIVASYEKLAEYATLIKNSKDTNVLNAYYYQEYNLMPANGNIKYTLDYAFLTVRGKYVTMFDFPVYVSENKDKITYMWEGYKTSNISELLADTYSVIYAGFKNIAPSKEDVVKAMDTYNKYFNNSELDVGFKLFHNEGIGFYYADLYFDGLMKYFESESQEIQTLVEKIIEVQKAFVENEGVEDAITAMMEAKNAIQSTEDLAIYNELLATTYDKLTA